MVDRSRSLRQSARRLAASLLESRRPTGFLSVAIVPDVARCTPGATAPTLLLHGLILVSGLHLFAPSLAKPQEIRLNRGSTMETISHFVVPDLRIEVRVAVDDPLQRVDLILEDSSIPDGDSRLIVFDAATPHCVARQDLTHGPTTSLHTFQMNLPLWLVGRNAFIVEARTRTRVGQTRGSFLWPSDRSRGIRRGTDGRSGTAFGVRGLPILAHGCPFAFCKDADQDGLLDLWESVVSDALRPVVVHDEDEELFEHPEHHVRVFMSTYPVRRSGTSDRYIAVKYSIAYSRDYGTDVPILDAITDLTQPHSGDAQKLTVFWRLVGETIEVAEMRTWAHGYTDVAGIRAPGDDMDRIFPASDMTFDSDGIMHIYAEEDKHGLWPSASRCNDLSRYDCHPSSATTIRPAAFNLGEPPGGLPGGVGRSFLDQLDAAEPFGPHNDLLVTPGRSVFPGEWVWNDPDGRFCGGQPCDDDGPPGFLGDAFQNVDFHLADRYVVAYDPASIGARDNPLLAARTPSTSFSLADYLRSATGTATLTIPGSSQVTGLTLRDYGNVRLSADPGVSLRVMSHDGRSLVESSPGRPLAAILAPVEPGQPLDFGRSFPPDDPLVSRRLSHAVSIGSERSCTRLQIELSTPALGPDEFDRARRNETAVAARLITVADSLVHHENLTLHESEDRDYYRVPIPAASIDPRTAVSLCENPRLGIRCRFQRDRLAVSVAAKRYDSSFRGELLTPREERIDLYRQTSDCSKDALLRQCLGTDTLLVKVYSGARKTNMYDLRIEYNPPRLIRESPIAVLPTIKILPHLDADRLRRILNARPMEMPVRIPAERLRVPTEIERPPD